MYTSDSVRTFVRWQQYLKTSQGLAKDKRLTRKSTRESVGRFSGISLSELGCRRDFSCPLLKIRESTVQICLSAYRPKTRLFRRVFGICDVPSAGGDDVPSAGGDGDGFHCSVGPNRPGSNISIGTGLRPLAIRSAMMRVLITLSPMPCGHDPRPCTGLAIPAPGRSGAASPRKRASGRRRVSPPLRLPETEPSAA